MTQLTRLTRLRDEMRRQGLDALWVSQPANVRYLSGFTHPADGKVFVTLDRATLYTDSRYTVQAQDESRLPQHIARPPATFEHAAGTLGRGVIGFEADHVTVAGLDELKRAWPDAELRAVLGLVQGLRLRKDDEEIAAIRAAQELADRVYAEVRPLIRAGVRESEVAQEIERRLRQAGASNAFDVIVASGPRGAMPHGTASDRVMQDGELVTVDMGASLNGYNSDMTRTVAIGTPTGELQRVYNAVLEAEEAAVRAVKPGVRAADLDTLARDILDRHGLKDAFAHSLGHGVGLQVHEGPGLRGASEDVLEAGMVITIEPGAYLPGLGGVRIEDLVLVTGDGHEVLSRAVKEPV